MKMKMKMKTKTKMKMKMTESGGLRRSSSHVRAVQAHGWTGSLVVNISSFFFFQTRSKQALPSPVTVIFPPTLICRLGGPARVERRHPQPVVVELSNVVHLRDDAEARTTDVLEDALGL